MSLFGSIGNAIKGGLAGFAQGGFYGAVAGAAGGALSKQPKNPAKTKNLNPVLSAQREAARTTGVQTVPTVAQYSASNFVRAAYQPGSLVPIPSMPTLVPSGPGGTFGGSGATGSYSAAPAWAVRRLYTKKGTPRRIRRDGQPYAVPRMNAMNVRAARRAIRRIRGARKLLQRIERSLPKAHVRRRAA